MATRWQRKAPDFWVKQEDTSPAIAFQLLDGTGAVVNLTGATVKFMMQAPGAASPKINATAAVTDPLEGTVAYQWAGTNTDTAGDYLAEFQVTYSGGTVETFPNGDLLKVRVLDDIAA